MTRSNFGVIKPEIRVLGVDDGVFTPHVESLVPVVGVVFRGGYWLDGVMHTEILVDGFDATERISTHDHEFSSLRAIEGYYAERDNFCRLQRRGH